VSEDEEQENDDTDDAEGAQPRVLDKARFVSALDRMEKELAELDGDAENTVKARVEMLKTRVEEIKKKREQSKAVMAKQEKLLAKLDKKIDHLEGKILAIDVPMDEAIKNQRAYYEKRIASLKKRVEQHVESA